MTDKLVITLVRSRIKSRPYAKTDCKFIGPSWNNDIGLQSVKDTPEDMFNICKVLLTKHDTCMVTGTAMQPEIKDTDRTLKNFVDEPIKYLILDLDKYEYSTKDITYDKAVKEVNKFIEDFLPPEFQDTTYILRFSSSFLIGDKPYLRCHIIFLLDKSQYPREIGIWMRKDGIPADSSFYFNLTQPLFTSEPVWKDLVDPLTIRGSAFPRISIVKKHRSHVLPGWQPYTIDRRDTVGLADIPPASKLPGKIGSFCRMVHPAKALLSLGYTDEGDGRFLAPSSKSGVAGTMLFKNGYVYSHHSDDPINQIVSTVYGFKRKSLNSYDIMHGWAILNREHDPSLLKEFDFALNQAVLNDTEYQDEIVHELIYRTEWLTEGEYEGINRKIIEGVLRDMHDLYLTELSREHIFNIIKAKTKGINLTVLKRMHKSIQKDKATRHDDYDPDAGLRHMANIFKRQKVFYSHHYTEYGDFWCYFGNKRLWKRCNATQAKGFIYNHIHTTVPIKIEIDFNKYEQLTRLIIREACLEETEFKKGAGWAFKNGRYGVVMGKLFSDSHQWLSDKEIRTLRKDDNIYKELPITYKEWVSSKDVVPHKYIEFLESTCEEDMETVELIREYGGYILADSYYIHKMLIIEGVPGSGKSILAKILGECIGHKYFEAISINKLPSTFGLGTLAGKKLAIMSEAREVDFKLLRALVPVLLRVIGQDYVDTEAKNKNIITELLECKLLMLTNLTPVLPDDTGALAQRIMMIKFNKQFRDTSEEILGLDAVIIKEGLASIIRWHLKGLERLSKRKNFVEPSSGLVVKRALKEQIDPLRSFIHSYFTMDTSEDYADYFILQKEFIRYFRVYCYTLGQPTKIGVVRKRASVRTIQSLYPKVKVVRLLRDGKQEYVYKGLAVDMDVLRMTFEEDEKHLIASEGEED